MTASISGVSHRLPTSWRQRFAVAICVLVLHMFIVIALLIVRQGKPPSAGSPVLQVRWLHETTPAHAEQHEQVKNPLPTSAASPTKKIAATSAEKPVESPPSQEPAVPNIAEAQQAVPAVPEPSTPSPQTAEAESPTPPTEQVAQADAPADEINCQHPFPEKSRTGGNEGKVVLFIRYDEQTGHPTIVQIETSSGYPNLDQLAIDIVTASWSCKFRRNGHEHRGWTRTHITFTRTHHWWSGG